MDDLHDVVFVEGDGGVGQVLLDSLDEGRRHIDGDIRTIMRIAVVLPEVLGKRRDGLRSFAFCDKEGALFYQIDKEGDIVMSFCLCCFINPYRGETGLVLLLTCRLGAVVHHSPELVIIHMDDLRHLIDRHLSYQGPIEGFKEKGKVCAIPRPRHIDLEYSVIRAVNSGDPYRQIAGILEEVEMSPLFLRGVVGLLVFPADRTAERASPWKIGKHLYGSFVLIKRYLGDLPRGFQFQGSCKERL